jgi:hypothetical protein
MLTAFFGVNGVGPVKILPTGQKLRSEHFKDEILREIYCSHLTTGGWRLAAGSLDSFDSAF